MTNGDVLERYRAMLETPSILAVDPSALLRDMAAEIERLRGPRADMNEKAIEAAAKALVPFSFGAFEFQTDAEGNRVQPPFQPNDHARRAAFAAVEAYLSALPLLRAREEIARKPDDLSERIRAKMQEPAFRELGERLDANINWPRYLPIQKVRPTAVSDWLVRLSSGREIGLTNDEWESALSSAAGQEWRDISSAKKVHAHRIAMTLCEVDGHDPDDEAPLTEMCDDANMPVPWWMVYVEYAEALLDKFTILPAPPVAEPKP